MDLLVDRLSLTTAALSALTGGAFFAFSGFVMPALRALPPETAVAAMQAINRAAPRSVLMVPLLGSAVGAAVVGAYAVVAGNQPGRGWLLLGAVAGLVSLGITSAYHVPRNTALGLVDPHAADAAAVWTAYAAGWTAMNHVRTAVSLISAAALVAATRASH